MATTAREPGVASTSGLGESASGPLSVADRVELLRYMLLIRGIEARALSLYRQGKVPGSFYDGYGQEAVSAGAAFALAPEDRLCVLHRDLAAHLVRGVAPERVLAQYMGRAGGVTGGRDGNVHFGDRTVGCVGMVSMLPDMMVVATGMAMAFKLRGERRVALTWMGDGASSRGDWHEAMNWAGVQRRPDADRGDDHAHARARRPRRHALRPARAARAMGGARPDRSPGRARGRARRRHRGAAGRGRRRGGPGHRGGAGDADARPVHRDRGRLLRRRGRAARRRPGPVERVPHHPGSGVMAELSYLQAISDGLREEMR